MLNEGDIVPDLTLHTPEGGTLRLSQVQRPLVLYFYPKDDTPGCTTEAKDFSDLAGAFEMEGASVIGVSRDDATSHGKFIAKHGLKVPLATDMGEVSDAFGTWGEKSMYGRTYMGMERATFLLDAERRIVKAWRKVKVPGHAEAVLAEARALKLADKPS